ncbi:Ubiquinol oxidase [Quillaja saponaria]|uniref:Ubiquinol oxidase n=1 Tax=Quillaja saponaria TaxID=32244 RepID=A0AAD7L8E7_QUISA|nr:Ubiquinol oxidase [Quillaja saponaria]
MMMRRSVTRHANTMLVTVGTRFFSGTAATKARAVAKEVVLGAPVKGAGHHIGTSMKYWIRSPAIHGKVRNLSYASLEKEQANRMNSASVTDSAGENKNEKEIVSYWGVPPSKITKEDGTEWNWNCFRPWEAYKADLSIDLKKHHVPVTFMDKLAYWIVKALRLPTDIFFQRRYGCRAMMLETVAAVPGMVGGMLLHCKSLRRFEHSGGWIKALLEEAENERMHLMTFMEVAKPRWYERALVFTVQGVFFNAYFLGYLMSPKFAHRMVGYLEEEAIHSYTEFLKELDKGNIENVPAPAIAIDYWQLPPDSTLRDVVMVVRADEAHHRDVNHFASDIHYQGRELRESPAPVGYH